MFRIPTSDQQFSIPLDPEPPQAQQAMELDPLQTDYDPFADEPQRSNDEALESQPTEALAEPESTYADVSSLASGNATLWYVRPPSGGQYGPADNDLMQQWINESRVVPGSLVWRDGWPQWRASEEVFQSGPDQADYQDVDLESDLPQVPGEPISMPALSTDDSKAVERKQHETDFQSRAKARRKKRTIMIAMLTGISVFLVVVIIMVIVSQGGSDT